MQASSIPDGKEPLRGEKGWAVSRAVTPRRKRVGLSAASRATDAGESASSVPRIGLALAGGGPLGAIYEIGAVAALAEALDGLDINDLHVYVGVSSGSFIAAGLANGITPHQMARMFIESESAEEPFQPGILLKPAFGEFWMRAASVPSLFMTSLRRYLSDPLGGHFVESFQHLFHAIPTGVFSNRELDAFLRRLFSVKGRTNDFRQLRRKLYLAATDLDSGETVEFGASGSDHVPISTAMQASAALPGLFPPVEIDGRYYVDGALKKTLHASVALRQGAGLVLCVNPLVPFDSNLAAQRGRPYRHRLVEGGLPQVLSQTFRAIIHSRMQAGMGKYATEFPDADVVLFEPNGDDADMFFTNVFSYASRRRLSEHAYQRTRSELLRRRAELEPIFLRHGIRLRMDVLQDRNRHLVRAAGEPHASTAAMETADRLAGCLDELESWAQRR
jgi:predicted acylesterase/phospholipase RssA